MKKGINLFTLIGSCLLIVLFIFITLLISGNSGWLGHGSFWVAWVMTVIPVVASTIVTTMILRKFSSNEMFVSFPIIYVSSAFNVISTVLGFILCLTVGMTGADVQWWQWGIEVVFIIIYIAFFFYIVYGSNYMAKNRRHVKVKVNYIRRNVAKLNSLIATLPNGALKEEMEKLRDNIRFSDPMSNSETLDLEISLDAAIDGIIDDVSKELGHDAIKSNIFKANALIARRNEIVKYSK